MMKLTGQSGSTILLVTWLLAIMGVVATFLIYRSEAEWAVVLKAEANATIRELAKQALYDQLSLLVEDDSEHDTPDEPWFNQTGRIEREVAGYRITMIVEDEGSKPNLNLIGGGALRELLPPDDQTSIDPVLDWRDYDSDVRPEGAEEEFYRALVPPYKPRNGFFSTLTELLAVKDGELIYPYFAPELTVYGKLNLNVLQLEQLEFLLRATGEFQGQLDSVLNAINNYQNNNRFENLKSIEKVDLIPVGTADKLLPFFNLASTEETFTGACNLNFVSYLGLKIILLNIGFKSDDTTVTQIINRRKDEPFENIEVIAGVLGVKEEKLKQKLHDYFTTKSSIFRFRIWVTKANQRFYLNTVQQRVPGDLRVKWIMRTLYWQTLSNRKVPEIPELTPFEETLKEPEPAESTPTPTVPLAVTG